MVWQARVKRSGGFPDEHYLEPSCCSSPCSQPLSDIFHPAQHFRFTKELGFYRGYSKKQKMSMTFAKPQPHEEIVSLPKAMAW